MILPECDYLAITGPTASGKSALAHELALRHGGEIINCDSVQVYRCFDIGSAKVSRRQRQEIPYHLIDCLDPNEDYDANQFRRDCLLKISDILQRGKLPIVVGGSGLYLRALWQDRFDQLPTDAALRADLNALSAQALQQKLAALNPQRAAEIHVNDHYRLARAVEIATLQAAAAPSPNPERQTPGFTAYKIYLTAPRIELHQRIARRSQQMLDGGLIAETEAIVQKYGSSPKALLSIGYRQVVDCLEGRLPESALAERITIATRQYAKRQETWFRKVEFARRLTDAADFLAEF